MQTFWLLISLLLTWTIFWTNIWVHDPCNAYHLPFRFDAISPDVLYKAGEAFIEPEVIPPLHGNQVTKPLQT